MVVAVPAKVSEGAVLSVVPVCVWAGNSVLVKVFVCEPPVVPGLVTASGTPRINLSKRLGVPLVPSHNNQPVGIVARVPLHMLIIPEGIFMSLKLRVAITCHLPSEELY